MRGLIKNLSRDFITKHVNAVIEFTEVNTAELNELMNKDIDIDLKPHKNKRSKNANALLWECLGRCAEHMNCDKWDLYLSALKHYGQYTVVEVRQDAVERFKSIYRECEEVGHREDMVQLLCYYGSSTYNTKEFSRLLDGVITDMKNAGITTPTDEDLQRALEQWENGKQK